MCDVAARRKTKGTLGGWRPGAGRKPELKDPARFTLDFEGADFAALETLARERGVSVASVVREAAREYVARRRRK
jgi:hypothetical protein